MAPKISPDHIHAGLAPLLVGCLQVTCWGVPGGSTVALILFVCGIALACAPQIAAADFRADATAGSRWHRHRKSLVLAALTGGSLVAGRANFAANAEWAAHALSGRVYSDVDVSTVSPLAVADASLLSFKGTPSLGQHSALRAHGTTFCVAELAKDGTASRSVYAAGLNCCSRVAFWCDDAAAAGGLASGLTWLGTADLLFNESGSSQNRAGSGSAPRSDLHHLTAAAAQLATDAQRRSTVQQRELVFVRLFADNGAAFLAACSLRSVMTILGALVASALVSVLLLRWMRSPRSD